MKVLITGSNGQVGNALVRSAPKEFTVKALGHADLDITSESAVGKVFDDISPDFIINAAAYTAVDRAESEPEQARACNAVGPRNLAKSAAQRGVKLLHLSTDFVFDGEASKPYSPEDATNPLSVYGQTKREGELAVLSQPGLSGIVLRTAWVYAAAGNNFVKTMLRLMKERGAVRVVRDQIGTPTAAHSVAEIAWKIVGLKTAVGIYHWTDAGVASWYDFAVAIAEEAADLGHVAADVHVTAIPAKDYPTPARRPRFSVMDSSKTLAEASVMPVHWRVNLRRVLREILRA